jgi:hypothetical protein
MKTLLMVLMMSTTSYAANYCDLAGKCRVCHKCEVNHKQCIEDAKKSKIQIAKCDFYRDICKSVNACDVDQTPKEGEQK